MNRQDMSTMQVDRLYELLDNGKYEVAIKVPGSFDVCVMAPRQYFYEMIDQFKDSNEVYAAYCLVDSQSLIVIYNIGTFSDCCLRGSAL